MLSRYSHHLGERYAAIGSYLGLIFPIMAIVMLVPLLTLLFVPSDVVFAPAFWIPASIFGSVGLMIRMWLGNRSNVPLDFNESSIVVFITWITISIAGAVPYMLISGLSFTHAVFDSVSGWTTTGLSLLDVTKAPVIVLFYRAWTQLVGGAGIAIIMLASLTGSGTHQIYSAEGKGTLIKPNVLASARIVISIYMIYMVLGIVLYLVAGMNLLDALVHCFAAISTGGFSNYTQNIGYFDSASIESISILLMILGNMSFLMGYFLINGKFKSIARNGEIKVMFVSLMICIPLIYYFVAQSLYDGNGKAIRVAIFEAVSSLTTTGFSTVSYTDPAWLDGGVFILIILMLIGGGTCSTAGGMKQYRVYMLYKSMIWHLKSSLLPNNCVRKNFVWEGDLKAYQSDNKIVPIANFVILYLSFFVLGSLVIAFSKDAVTGINYSLRDSLFEFASSLGTVGITIGVSTTHAPNHVIWIETVGMLLGRLEFYVVFIALIKFINDAKRVTLSHFLSR